MSNVTLSASARSNLLSLQNTASLIGRTQQRLSSGLAVASPVDDAVKYFQAKSLSSRATDLSERKDSIDQGISTLEAALKATDAMESLIQRMKGIVEASRSQSASERAASQTQLTELTKQVQNLVDDASYKGLNLLNSDSSKLSVRFSEKTESKLEVSGVDFNTGALFLDTSGASVNATAASIAQDLGFAGALDSYDFTNATELAAYNSEADTVVQNLEATISNLRAKSATMAANSDVLKVRLDFTKEYVDTLKTGADKLRLADLNEEAANLLALQTRQQIGIQALSFAGQSEQSILSLFR